MKISNNVTFAEATKSRTATKRGIKNIPNHTQLERMKLVSSKIFQPLRAGLGYKPIAITSFFRSEKLNKAIGGSNRSQHCKGEAMDIDGDVYGYHDNSAIFHYIRLNLDFDQLIWEFGDKNNPNWVHVSYTERRANRGQILVAYKNWRGKTKYKIWAEN